MRWPSRRLFGPALDDRQIEAKLADELLIKSCGVWAWWHETVGPQCAKDGESGGP